MDKVSKMSADKRALFVSDSSLVFDFLAFESVLSDLYCSPNQDLNLVRKQPLTTWICNTGVLDHSATTARLKQVLFQLNFLRGEV